MLKSFVLSAAIVMMGLTATPVWAADPTCKLTSGEPVPELETLNALILAADFDGLAKAVSATINIPADGIASLKAAIAKPFVRCTTLVQREDTGGMIQEVVMFESDDGTVFYSYWVGGYWNGDFDLRYLNVNTDFKSVMEALR